MVIFKEGHWMKNSAYPDIDFTNGEALYCVPDNSELALKIQFLGIVDFILDDEGNLIDVEAKPTPVDKIEQIKTQLNEIDLATVRPLRAILSDSATEVDYLYLQDLETRAQTLRSKLKAVQEKAQEQGADIDEN